MYAGSVRCKRMAFRAFDHYPATMNAQIPSDADLLMQARALGAAALAARHTLVTAESCSGGWIAKVLTDVAGSSEWFEAGMVAYSYEAKQALLGVRPETLMRHGAVSEETALEMVSGALIHSGATLAVAVTGIAGPGGGTPDKPVGSVWIAWKRRGGYPRARLFRFDGDREAVRRQTVAAALEGLAMNNNSHSQSRSLPAVLTAAPHRLLFFAGALNVLAATAWWTWWLFHTVPLPVEQVTGGWLHGFIVQYQMLPSFMLGFLITVFPRWMGQAEPTRRHYVPVGLGMLLGQVLCLAAAFTGSAHALHLGVVLTILGWGYGLVVLGTVLVRNRFQTWHAVSCYTALTIGFLGLLGFAVYLHSFGRPFNLWLGQAVMQIGTFGVLLPIYATVAHRMFPFFAGNVVAGYQSWRPMWLLGAQWPFWLLHVGLEASGHKSWLWLADAPLLLIALVCLFLFVPLGLRHRLLGGF